MDWTEDRIETLTRLWRGGYSASQVAQQLGGVSRSAVIGKVHRMGLAGRDVPSRPRKPDDHTARRDRASAGGVRRVAPPRETRAGAASPRTPFEVAPTATIVTLTEAGCRWPIGEPGEPGFGFCGRLKMGHGAYCAGHSPMATRGRAAAMKDKDIDRVVRRLVDDGGRGSDWRRPSAAQIWKEAFQ
jgi:GcrA cell cycle regulator